MGKMTITLFLVLANITINYANNVLPVEKSYHFIPFDDSYEYVYTTNEEFHVQYYLDNGTIFVECAIKDFILNNEANHFSTGANHLVLYINGQQEDTFYQPSFMIKSLPSGAHVVKIELVDHDGTSLGKYHEFEVTL